MIEVFKTNVKDQNQANMLIDQIHKICVDCRANFDLQDCDHILRVKCTGALVESSFLISLLKEHGCHAEILEDTAPGLKK